MSRLTDSLLGLSEGPARAPNTYSVGRYLAILVVKNALRPATCQIKEELRGTNAQALSAHVAA